MPPSRNLTLSYPSPFRILCASLAELKQTAARLMDSGASDRETTHEMRRVNEEFVDTQHRFQDVDDEIQGMQARLVSERDVAESLRMLDPVWDELFPLEQSRIVHLLVERVTVNTVNRH